MGGREPAAEFRTTTVERALAEQPSGLTLHALVQRLAPHFDVGDVLVVLRRRPDVFLQWDGRWLSRAASLDQPPRRLRCDFDYEAIPSEWQVFANPWGAANGWRTYHHQLQENAFDPQTAHIKVVPEGSLLGPGAACGLYHSSRPCCVGDLVRCPFSSLLASSTGKKQWSLLLDALDPKLTSTTDRNLMAAIRAFTGTPD